MKDFRNEMPSAIKKGKKISSLPDLRHPFYMAYLCGIFSFGYSKGAGRGQSYKILILASC